MFLYWHVSVHFQEEYEDNFEINLDDIDGPVGL
jgi:hypothetical protein